LLQSRSERLALVILTTAVALVLVATPSFNVRASLAVAVLLAIGMVVALVVLAVWALRPPHARTLSAVSRLAALAALLVPPVAYLFLLVEVAGSVGWCEWAAWRARTYKTEQGQYPESGRAAWSPRLVDWFSSDSGYSCNVQDPRPPQVFAYSAEWRLSHNSIVPDGNERGWHYHYEADPGVE